LTEEQKSLPRFGIPYGALVPAHVSGLLTCGKIISGTHIAMSSYRVQPIAAQTGQAAGLAAAACIDQKCMPAEIDVRKLRQSLQATGIEVERG